MAGGFVYQMTTDPNAQLHNPAQVIAYAKSHIVGYLVATLLAPMFRGTMAYRSAKQAGS